MEGAAVFVCAGGVFERGDEGALEEIADAEVTGWFVGEELWDAVPDFGHEVVDALGGLLAQRSPY